MRVDRPRREPLRRLDAAGGLHRGARRAVRGRARDDRLAREARAVEAAISDVLETDTATFETPYGPIERQAGGDEEPGQAWIDVSGSDRGLTVVERREVRLRRAWRRHRHQRGAQPGVGLARPARARGRRRLRVHGPGPADVQRPADPARGRPARRDVVRRAIELNQPAFGLIETFHDGPLPQRDPSATTAAATPS